MPKLWVNLLRQAQSQTGEIRYFADNYSTTGILLVDGVPDASRFHVVVGGIIEAAKRNAPNGMVRLFGEMVSLLYGQNLAGAGILEELWNSAIDTYQVPLLCTYALDGPEPDAQNTFPQHLVACHSHTLVV